MRKINAVLTSAILILFLIHGIEGGFQLMGLRAASGLMKALAWTLAALIGAHAVIGVLLTLQTFRARRKAGVSYDRQNALFWARRFSGIAVLAFLLLHFTAFGNNSGAQYRLRWFNEARLATQLLLVVSLAVHLLSNLKPLLIALGIPKISARAGELLWVMAVLLLFMAAALAVYYFRWNY